MSNKPNPESVKKVLAAGIVPGCRVVDEWKDEGIVPPVEDWFGVIDGVGFDTDMGYTVKLYSGARECITATILEPAPALPDNTQVHGHLITDRFPSTDEQP